MHPPAGDTPSPHAPAAKAEAIRALLEDRDRRRRAGERVATDRALLAAHPELMPELAAAVAGANGIRRAVTFARRAGPPRHRLTPFTDAALHAPLEADLDEPDPVADDPPAADGGDLQDDAAGADDPEGGGLGDAPGRGRDDPAHVSTVPDVPPPIPGYTITGEVGSGGQGAVHLAVQDSTGRRVAVKVLYGGSLAASRHRERFDREAEVLAAIQHPHVVGIIDRGRAADGSFFLVMPYVDGLPLDEHVARRRAEGTYDVRAVVRLFATLADAVGAAHRLQVVHRDLKPANVRVDADRGDPYVLDFGLARPWERSAGDGAAARAVTGMGQVVGSLPWASPEQVAGKGGLDARTDVYALGVMLYAALTGEPPYDVTASIRGTLDNIATAVPKPPSHLAVEMGRELDAVVLRCLAKRPADRYATAAELAADLERYLAGSGTVAYASPGRTRQGRAVRWRPSRAAVYAAAAAAAALVAAAGYGAWRAADRGRVAVAGLPAVQNVVGMRLVRLPAGSFLMGSARDEAGRVNGDRQRQEAVQAPFYIAATEVTRGQYRAVMRPDARGARWAGADPKTDGNLPAAPVTWDDATEFCQRLTASDPDWSYRLPTEVEWEYACRATTIGPYAGTGRLDDMGWYDRNAGRQLRAVAGKSPNHWGLFDMHGGVEEWCIDPYLGDPVAGDAATGTVGATAAPATIPAEPAGVVFRVVKGGSVDAPATRCRSGYRGARTAPGPMTGFRVVAVERDPVAR